MKKMAPYPCLSPLCRCTVRQSWLSRSHGGMPCIEPFSTLKRGAMQDQLMKVCGLCRSLH